MMQSLLVGLLILAACGGEPCDLEQAAARQFAFDWGDWRGAGAFGIEDAIYWVRLRNQQVEVTKVVAGKPLRLSRAKSSLVGGTVSGLTSDRDAALYFLVRTRGGGPAQAFRYDLKSGVLEEFWSGEISGVVIDSHFLSELGALAIVTQNSCYLLDDEGNLTEFGPATHAEAPWFYSVSAASARALALNLNDDLMVYEPGKPPKVLEERDQANGVREMASIGDQWIVLHSNSGAGRLLRLGPDSEQEIAAPPGRYLRVSGYGNVAVLWTHDSDELLFVGPDGNQHIDLNREEKINWSLVKGYSSSSVFLIDDEGYWVVSIPQSVVP